jgi:DNA polymerase-3 subunit alpha
MAHAPFVPLRIFSSFTMLEGALDPKDIAKLAKRHAFPAAAVTDRNGLYGAMPFSDAAMKAGVQPIIGALLCVARPVRDDVPAALDWLALYAQDEAGYRNLCELVSAAHLDRPVEQDPHVPFAALKGMTDGLICLTAGAEGAVARLFAEEQAAEAIDYVDRLELLFPGRLYVELSRRMNEVEARAEKHLIDLAYAHDLPLVATNPTCFGDEHFHAAHDAMLCIADSAYVDSDERRKSSPDAWLKPTAAMQALFEDLPEAIANTVVIAQRCAVAAPQRKPILPSLAGDREAEATKLRADARAGLVERLRKVEELSSAPVRAEPVEALPPSFLLEAGEQEGRASTSSARTGLGNLELEGRYPDYFARLDFELDVIIQMGFPGYFLIVADFIKWAKANGIPVGPGRGSGAGSVVAWALTITDLDPIKLGLLFERFLNPERVSMPDFDIDFCETRREEVIRYVQQRYGTDRVAQIITFGRLKARAVLKDTGRVLQMSYGQVDRLAKLVPNHPTDPWTLERAINGVSELAAEYKNDAQVKRLLDLAMKLEGFPRHSSTHAAGVVIGDRPLAELVPLYRDPRSDMPVTQFDMKYVEGAGLVKFDFLGLKTLSVLQKAVEMLAARDISVDLDALAWDDEEVYQLLQRGETVGVFQLESEGMRRTLAAVKPTNFGDIIALVSLYRPGPMDNIPLFGDRKNGRAKVEYPHPLLETILAETYGIFVYQEQVMQAAQILAGYSLGGADLLRRAMGKKIKAEMDAQRAIFVEGCAKTNGIPADKANVLFDLIDKFAGYGFNKSHAAAYALLAYQTAWLKAHHPHEFYAASMCFDMAQTDKLCVFVDDMRRLDVAVLPPDVNVSGAEFGVEELSPSPSGEGLSGPLCARCTQECRRAGDGAAGRGAGAGRRLQEPRRFRAPGRPQAAQPAADGEPRGRRCVRFDRAGAGRRFRGRGDDAGGRGACRGTADERAGRAVRHGGGERADDQAAAQCALVARRTDGPGEGGVRLLFLRASDRPVSPPGRGAWRQELWRGVRDQYRRGAGAGHDGGPDRGRALADLGEGAALSARYLFGRDRTIRRELFRRDGGQGSGGGGADRRLRAAVGRARPAGGRGDAARDDPRHPAVRGFEREHAAGAACRDRRAGDAPGAGRAGRRAGGGPRRATAEGPGERGRGGRAARPQLPAGCGTGGADRAAAGRGVGDAQGGGAAAAGAGELGPKTPPPCGEGLGWAREVGNSRVRQQTIYSARRREPAPSRPSPQGGGE